MAGDGGKTKKKAAAKKVKQQALMSAVGRRTATAAGTVPVMDGVDPNDARATVVDSRRAMATTVFTADALGLKSTKRCPTTDNMKTVFAPEATHDVARRVRDACRPLRTGEREQLSLEAYSASSQACDMMPQRPVWDYSMSSGRVHYREGKAFMAWLARMRERIMERGGYAPVFEQNLQVWRQLWRVVERADVVVVVMDVRHPLLHLPPALYLHVAHTLAKPLVCCLNKVDLVSEQHAAQWAAYLTAALPGVAAVVGFSCTSPTTADDADADDRVDPAWETAAQAAAAATKAPRHRVAPPPPPPPPLMDATGAAAAVPELPMGKVALLAACARVAVAAKAAAASVTGGATERGEKQSAASERAAAATTTRGGEDDEEDEEEEDEVAAVARQMERSRLQQEEDAIMGAKADGTRVMLGLVGHPNVGKSSVLNTLVGRKAVSVKNTPGHTKILQTYILDDHACLIDSPGVVFPRVDVPLEAQIVGGLVPLAQVREPFTSVRWLAENAVGGAHALPETLNLKPLSGHHNDLVKLEPTDPRILLVEQGGALPWSPLSICTQYARLRGFVRNGHADVINAGTTVLRRVLDLRLAYAVPPPPALPAAAVTLPTADTAALARDDVADAADDVSDASYDTEDEEVEQTPQSLFMASLSEEAREQYGL